MSAPSDVNVRVKFTANTAQIKQMFGQMRKLQNTVKKLGKDVTKLGSDMKKAGSRFDTTNSKVKKINKTFTSLSQKQDRARSSVKKLTSAQKGYGSATDKMTKANKRGNTSLGFTGLAFGFIGGIAGFAATQIRTQFISALEDTATLMSEISRINLFSDVGIANGIVNITELENQTKKVFDLARETGILTQDVATIIKEVEKAAPFSLDTEVFTELVVGMKLLENTLDASTISADIITIQSNFEEMDLGDLVDQVFAFGKANKLTFSASAKAIGFAAQNAKILGSDLKELSRVMTVVSNKIPGFQGNAGRAVRRLSTAFQDPTTIKRLRDLGINLLTAEGRFIGLENAIDLVGGKFNEFNDVNQEQGAQFLELIRLSENARLALLAYADASTEVKAAAAQQFEDIGGNFAVAVEFQKTQPEAVLGIFKNQITELKTAFTSGLFPAISQINDSLKETFASGEIISVLKELGRTIGSDLVAAANVFIPVIRLLGAFLASASPIVQLLAKSMTGLFLALSAITIVFPMLGFFFALIFLHEKLITRSIQLGTSATFVTKAYVRLTNQVSLLNLRFSVWLTQLRAGNLSMGILSKQGILGLRKSLIALGAQMKTQILGWGVFTAAANTAAFAAARAWFIALLPIAITIAAFIALIFLANRYKESLISVADQLDETGVAGDNLRSNIEGAFAILTTGDLTPALEIVEKDFGTFADSISGIGDAWNIFVEDLTETALFKLFSGFWIKMTTDIDNAVISIDNFANSIILGIPETWNALWQWISDIGQEMKKADDAIIAFVDSLGFELPEPLQKVLDTLSPILDILLNMLLPIAAIEAALNFKFPDVLRLIEEALDRIAKHPLVKAGLQIQGVIDNFITNIGKKPEDQKKFFPGPFDLLDPDTRIPTGQVPTTKELFQKFFDDLKKSGPQLTDFEKGTTFEGDFKPKFKSKKQIEQDRLTKEEFRPQLDLDFGLPPETQEALVATTGTFVQTLQATNTSFEESNIALGNSAVLLEEGQELLEGHNTAVLDNSTIVNTSTGTTQTQIDRLFGQIVEIIRNTNALSALTTMIAVVQLMFVNLVAQGNRAAGKLASLRVSSRGKFSITDPGISASDQAAINDAALGLAQAKANQTNIAIPTAPNVGTQNNNITINPSITINNAEGLNTAELVELINIEFAKTLQKNAPQIISV